MHESEVSNTPMPAPRRRPIKQPSRLLLVLVLVAGMVTINVDFSVGEEAAAPEPPPSCTRLL